MAEPPILLLTHSGDFFTIDRVEAAVRDRGLRPLRINTDRFPADLRLAARFSSGGCELWLDAGAESIRLDQVRAVWSRRLWPGWLPDSIDPRYAQHCRTESRNAFFGIFSLMDQAFWINRIDKMLAAESKPLQLELASQVGLRAPETLITNDPERTRRFFGELDGRMITKLLGALSQTMDASGDFVYTSEVTADDVADLEGLRWAPQIFQPFVEKDRELRVIVVGQRIFAASIDVSKSDRARVDWRRATTADGLSWKDEALPPDVAAGVHRLMGRLGLVYGALDFIVDKEGRYWFLEINPAGEWGWLERDLGMAISGAIADELVRGARA